MNHDERIWKIRAVKTYPEAHTHLLIGRVDHVDQVSIEFYGISLHMGRAVNSVKDVHVGPVDRRIIPWSRVEIINVLPADFAFDQAELTRTETGEIILRDETRECSIAMGRGPRY